MPKDRERYRPETNYITCDTSDNINRFGHMRNVVHFEMYTLLSGDEISQAVGKVAGRLIQHTLLLHEYFTGKKQYFYHLLYVGTYTRDSLLIICIRTWGKLATSHLRWQWKYQQHECIHMIAYYRSWMILCHERGRIKYITYARLEQIFVFAETRLPSV